MKRHAFAAGAAALSLTLAACGSSTTTTTTPTSAPTTTTTSSAPTTTTSSSPTTSTATSTASAKSGVVIAGFAYSGTLTVKPGEKVTVTNKDPAPHTVTGKGFDSGKINANGGTGTFTAPTKPGSYPVKCKFHPKMAGTLIVKN